jgi:hypothetical protein
VNFEPAEQHGKAAAHSADAAAAPGAAALQRRTALMRQSAAGLQPAAGVTRVQLIFREMSASAVTRGVALIDGALLYAPEGVRKHARSHFPGVLGAPSPHIPTPFFGEDAANKLDAGTTEAAPETGRWIDNALFAEDEDGR